MTDLQHGQFRAAPAWLRSPVGLGRAAVAGLGLVIATDLVAVWADYGMYDLWADYADGTYDAVLDGRASRVERLYSWTGMAQTAALIASVVLFLCWFHRVRVNAEVFSPFGHSKKRGWAIGGWFVPIIHLWYPRRITLDIWDASSPWAAPRPHGLVNAWWTLWVISLIAGRASFTQYKQSKTPKEIQDAVQSVLITDVLDIAAAALAIAVVLRLTRMQHEKALQGPAPVPA
ncbi:DUF4328 domain-containing protein [Streptomyces cupreus]|uniref:DUF4328 domain-containing protein n=1 Tax=Streptomyces cupreus TaxID=2759956 RepID=A0A7X1J475_9ACTN|nr:DUF4328 domain-containing protein [Streptomyces cupreus]MBC2901422.1 DUF4328 domain-containing protein [Streptomyces cupreus]